MHEDHHTCDLQLAEATGVEPQLAVRVLVCRIHGSKETTLTGVILRLKHEQDDRQCGKLGWRMPRNGRTCCDITLLEGF